MTTSERRLAAIMFTDLVGYSALTQQNEALALELVDIKQQLLNPLLDQHNGSFIKSMGDGLLVEFASALQAVQCGLAIQSMLKGYNSSQDVERQINVRIGIHLGDVEFKNGDVLGDGVNIASRIEPLAEAGEVCVSEDIVRQVEGKLEASFESLGTPKLKNIEKEIQVFKVSASDLASSTAGVRGSKHDQKLKIASIAAVIVIAVVAALFLIQSQYANYEAHLEPGEITSIAVIPFENLSSDPENQYFTEGLAEEMRNALVKIEGLRVPSYTSSSSGNLNDLSLKEIAELLDVQAILEGTVRKSGDQLRITAQFIRASDDTHLWSESFNKQAGDIFEIQENIAQAIVQKLGYSSNKQQIVVAGTESVEAHNLYLQGRFLWNQRSAESISKAIQYFDQALAIDPNYAQAYAALADAYVISPVYDFMLPDEAFPKAREYAEFALEINANLAQSYTTLGWIEDQYQYNFEKAEEYYLQSIELDPNYPTAHHWYSILLNQLGRFDESLNEAQFAHNLDPLSPVILTNLAAKLRNQGRYEEAIEAIDKISEISPDYRGRFLELAYIYEEQGDWAKAEEIFISGLERRPRSNHLHDEYGLHHLWRGNFTKAEAEFDHALELAENSIRSRVLKAITLMFSNRSEMALSLLNEALLLDDESVFVLYWLAWAYFIEEEDALGMDVINRAVQIFHPSDTRWRRYFESIRGMFHARSGNIAQTQRSIDVLSSHDLYIETESPMQIAYIYAALRDADNTFTWIEEAIENQDLHVKVIKVCPVFDSYRDDTRFQVLLAKMGLSDQ